MAERFFEIDESGNIERKGSGSTSDDPLFVISVAARLAKVHPQTLRIYERKGFIKPHRVKNRRRYSEEDIEKCILIQELTQEKGVNLAGVKMILDMRNSIKDLQEKIRRIESETEVLRAGNKNAGRLNEGMEIVLIDKTDIALFENESRMPKKGG